MRAARFPRAEYTSAAGWWLDRLRLTARWPWFHVAAEVQFVLVLLLVSAPVAAFLSVLLWWLWGAPWWLAWAVVDTLVLARAARTILVIRRRTPPPRWPGGADRHGPRSRQR